jgi:hypothetical protein
MSHRFGVSNRRTTSKTNTDSPFGQNSSREAVATCRGSAGRADVWSRTVAHHASPRSRYPRPLLCFWLRRRWFDRPAWEQTRWLQLTDRRHRVHDRPASSPLRRVERSSAPPARPADRELDHGQGITLSPSDPARLSPPAKPLLARARRSSMAARSRPATEAGWVSPAVMSTPATASRSRRRSISCLNRGHVGSCTGAKGFVRARTGGLSSCFAPGDDLVRGARM